MKKTITSGKHNQKLFKISLVDNGQNVYYELSFYDRVTDQFLVVTQEFQSVEQVENALKDK